MRRYLPLHLALAPALAVCLADTAHSQVADINRDVAIVQARLPQFRRDSVQLWGFSSEGGVAIAYRDSAGAVRLIRVQLFGESGKTAQDFYFQRGALILCSKRDHIYNMPFNFSDTVARQEGLPAFDPKKTRVVRESFYFRDRQLVRWRDQKGVLLAPAPAYRDTAQQVLAFADTLLARVK